MNLVCRLLQEFRTINSIEPSENIHSLSEGSIYNNLKNIRKKQSGKKSWVLCVKVELVTLKILKIPIISTLYNYPLSIAIIGIEKLHLEGKKPTKKRLVITSMLNKKEN